MKTKVLLSSLFCTILLGFSTPVRAQFNCLAPNLSINAGADTSVQCGACAPLNGTAFINALPTGYTQSAVPYTPFPFTSTTTLSLNDDQWSPVINLPFPFCYFGNTYNQCIIGSNGAVSFRLTSANGYCTWPIGAPVPSAAPADMTNAILAPWQDNNPAGQPFINYYTTGTAPCRAFVVNWNNIPMFSCTGVLNRYQAVLYEGSNVIDCFIAQKNLCVGWNGGRAIQAIQNMTGTVALVVPGRNFPTQWTATNDGQRWTPNGAPNGVFTWWDGATQIASGMSTTVCPTVPTTYTFQAVYTLCNGTTITLQDQKTVNSSGSGFNAALVSQAPVLCNGGQTGSASVSASGGTGPFSYAWNTVPPQNTATATNLPAGTYTCTITDLGSAGLCEEYINVTITQPTTLQLQLSSTPAFCNGQASGSATVVVNGGVPGYTYSWSPGGGTGATFSNITAGNYTVTVTDANLCIGVGNIVVAEPDAMQTVITASGVSCFGGSDGSLVSNTNGGIFPYTFAWNTTPQQTTSMATNLSGGSYTLTVTDDNGCILATTAVVPEPAQLQVTLNPTNNTCAQIANGFIAAVVSGGTGPFTYVWNTTPAQNTQTAVQLNGGSYSVTVTDANGCITTGSTTITPPPAIAVTITGPTHICEGETATITGSASGGLPPYTYAWTSSPQVFTGNSTSLTVTPQFGSNYFFTVTDDQGCVTTQMHPIDIYLLPSLAFDVIDRIGCEQMDILFDNNSGNAVSYTWTFGDGSPTSNDVNPIHTYTNGVYDVTLTAVSSQGCTNTITYPNYIQIYPGPDAHFSADKDLWYVTSLSNATFQFINESSNDVAWQWIFGDGSTSSWENPSHTYDFADTFAVTLIAYNEIGCTDTATHYPLIITPDGELFIPNTFTPNNDLLNDMFMIYGISVTEYSIQIFDRWGALMWFSNNINDGWNGQTSDNIQAPEGVYAWRINATFNDGHKTTKAGTITLVR